MENTEQNTDVAVETTPAVEETQPETNQSEVEESSNLKSGEDNNAQVDTTQTKDLGEQKSFNDLQATRKSLWDIESEKASQVETQMRSLSPAEQLAQWGMTAGDLKASKLEQEYLWDKVRNKHSELNPESKDFDPELDKLVYGNYVARKNSGENILPTKVADEIMNYLDKKTSKVKEATYKQAEDDISTKTLVSPKNPKRSSARGEISLSDLKNRARSGDASAIDELIRNI